MTKKSRWVATHQRRSTKKKEEEKPENKKNTTNAMTVRIFCPSHYRK